jgi:hypothetical protein
MSHAIRLTLAQSLWTFANLALGLGLTQALGHAKTPRKGPSVDFKHGALRISDNKRFLMHSDGTPFFYLGDTAWELFHRLNREDASRYLENRRQKGFTVIQSVVLAELDGLNAPNAYGEKPLVNNNPATPNEAYFQHVDYIVRRAEDKGIFIGMLPTWGDKVSKEWGVGPVIFDNSNARAYGRFLGARYKEQPNIIWILGGDRKGDGVEEIWRQMALGLGEGDGGSHLKTFHPMGGNSSSAWFHSEEWLDFNMLQSSHGRRDLENCRMVEADYERRPAKPCMDGEPRYEDHPIDWKPEKGWFDEYDVRQAAYWALFAGAHGHTYGCHDIWQMMSPGRTPISAARNNWYDVLDLPGAWDMLLVRNLLESRPFFQRIPDPSLLEDGHGTGPHHVEASRGDDYLFAYLPTASPITLQMGRISGKSVRAWWYNPRDGKATPIGTFPNEGKKEFTPPAGPDRNNDWVLVVDDLSRNFPAPGTRR